MRQVKLIAQRLDERNARSNLTPDLVIIIKIFALPLGSPIDEAFGVTIETGNKCPPLGRAILADASPSAVTWFQNAEIKHGRIAMVATIGFMVQKFGVHFPLYLGPSGFSGASTDSWLLSSTTGTSFADVSAAAPLDAISMVPLAGWAQVFAGAAWFECIAYQRQWNEGRAVPGDYGYDPLGFTKKAGGVDENLRIQEIKNGRLAMYVNTKWFSSTHIFVARAR